MQDIQCVATEDDKGVDSYWNSIKDKLMEIRDKFIPKYKKKRNKCKWVTKEVEKCRKEKTKAWNNYIKSGRNHLLFEIYKSKLRLSVRENANAKRIFEEKLANNIKKDSKSFYSYVKSKQRTKGGVGPLISQAGETVLDDKIAANMMNEYFASVFTVEDISNIPEPTKLFESMSEISKLKSIEITEEDVKNKLDKLKVGKSPGPDEIHPKFLYELRNELVRPLTKLFTLSLNSGIIPQEWKDAVVTPLFKKGNKSNVKNYRPVSLTSIVGKILESIMKDHIVEHLDKFHLIRSSQHGFTKGRSCLSNLLEFFEEVTKEVDCGNPVDLVYLDFAKAFDKVPHRRLFKKLESCGIEGSVLNWIKNWLSNRRQCVVVNRKFSSWTKVVSGVPQGSVLGPLLFVVYINDLEADLISRVGKFADDTKMSKSVRNLADANILQDDLSSLEKWAQKWQMEFNEEKCVVIHVGKTNKKFDYKLGN